MGSGATRQLIPKVFHHIWVGGAPIPADLLAYRASWQRHHPDWEMRLWTDANMPTLENQVWYDYVTIPAQKADIASFEILTQYGGIYLDMDFECFRNLEPLLAGLTAFCVRESKKYISHGIMGTVRGHPAFQALVDNLTFWICAHPHDPPYRQTGPGYITHVLDKRSDIHVFDPPLFYPYKPNQTDPSSSAFPDAYAAHHWAGSWLEPE